MIDEQPFTLELFDILTSTVIKTGDFLELTAEMQKGYVIRTEDTKEVVAITRTLPSGRVIICTIEPWISVEYAKSRFSKNKVSDLAYPTVSNLTETEQTLTEMDNAHAIKKTLKEVEPPEEFFKY